MSGGVGHEINELFVWVAEHGTPQAPDDGLIGVKTDTGWMPLVTTSRELSAIARRLAARSTEVSGMTSKLLHFTPSGLVVLERIVPNTSQEEK